MGLGPWRFAVLIVVLVVAFVAVTVVLSILLEGTQRGEKDQGDAKEAALATLRRASMDRTGGGLYIALVVVAVIAGLVAALDALVGLGYFLTALLLSMRGSGVNPAGLKGSGGFNPFLFLWMAQGGGTVVSCVLGMAGAGFAIAGSRPRTATWFMPAGVAASAYAYL